MILDLIFNAATNEKAGYRTITDMQTLSPENGNTAYLAVQGRSGHFIFSDADLSAQVALDTLQGIYIPANRDLTGATGAWVRQAESLDELWVEWFGATSGTNFVAAATAAIAMLSTNSGTIRFTGDYSGINTDWRFTRSKITIKGTGSNRLVFTSGHGLIIGQAVPSGGAKGGTKAVNVKLIDFFVTGETNYSGVLTHFEFVDEIKTINFKSAPIEISSASGSLCTGLKVSWVQWWTDIAGYYGGNYRSIFFNFENYSPNNEDHYHLYGTIVILQKGLISGQVASNIHVYFANGRTYGTSEASFDGCHFSEFADGSNNDVYGYTCDLGGSTTDRSIWRSVAFNDCMFEQQKYMFDTKRLNTATAGKDISTYVFNQCYFVGNAFRTNTLFIADTFKTWAVFNSCESSSITTLFDGIRCKFMGKNDLSNNYSTFSTSSYSYHEFIGVRPVDNITTKRFMDVTILSGATSVVIAHGLVTTPTKMYAVPVVSAHASHWWTSAGTTNVTLNTASSVAFNQTFKVYLEVAAS